MPYPEKIRNFWMNVAGKKCQQEFYTEQNGWEECNQTAKHVHHIEPERWTLEVEGKDADNNVALPLCENHHVRGKKAEVHSQDFTYHPDIGEAYSSYKDWKINKQRLEIKLEQKIDRRAYPSPFDEAVEGHKSAIAKGERYWEGTPEVEQHYIDKMRNKATKYIAETGEKKPQVNRRVERHTKKKKWYDAFFEDE